MSSNDKPLSLSAIASEIECDDDDFEDEAEFCPSDEFSADGEEDEKEDENYAILTGSLCLNDEGRLVYAGTWHMKNDDVNVSPVSSDGKKKKKKKFKLKSKQIVQLNDKKTFNLAEPLSNMSKKKKQEQRTLMFDGFFFYQKNEGGSDPQRTSKKVKERDVELSFSPFQEDQQKDEIGGEKQSGNPKVKVTGRGFNEFGAFTLDGSYIVVENKETESLDSKETPKVSVTITCNKRYITEKSSNGGKRKRSRSGSFDEDDDDPYDADEGADFDEIIALNEEANMSVEELRKRYLSSHDPDNKQNNVPSNKKSKQDDLSDDDEYGF